MLPKERKVKREIQAKFCFIQRVMNYIFQDCLRHLISKTIKSNTYFIFSLHAAVRYNYWGKEVQNLVFQYKDFIERVTEHGRKSFR